MQQAMFGMGGAAPAAAAAPAPEAPSQPDWSTQLQHMRELGIIDEVSIVILIKINPACRYAI
jgi:hypothetical protein